MRLIIYLLALITGLCAVNPVSATRPAVPVAVASAQYSVAPPRAHQQIVEQHVHVSQKIPRNISYAHLQLDTLPVASFACSTPIIRADRAHI